MLNRKNLHAVRRLAKEVADLTADVENEIIKYENRTGFKVRFNPNPSPATAALRRRSMDLTRALADLRSAQR